MKTTLERTGYATRMTAAKITELTTKFSGLGEDVFVHEHDYNQAENGRIAAKQDYESAYAEVERQKDAVSRFRGRAEAAEQRLAEVGRDGERYRWLRSHDVLCWSREPNGAGKAPIETSHGKKLDAAIDAAIKECEK